MTKAATREALLVKSNAAQPLAVLGTEVRFLCEGDRTERRWSLLEVNVPRDAGPPLHEHEWDEAYYVTRGSLSFTVGDRTVVVEAGDFLLAPGGTPHAFRGLSEEPACVLILDAPANAEGFFREVNDVVRSPEEHPLVPQIGLRHGIRFAPPPASPPAG